jgi:hypothetical protein
MKKHALTYFGLIALAAGCCIDIGDALRAKHKKTENLSLPIKDISELYIETDIGSITISGADVTDCNITAEITVKAATKEKARELAEQIRIELEPAGEKLSIKAGKPDGLKKRLVTVDFKITAPRQLNLNCETKVGSIKVSDMKGPIEASTDVGSIICRQVAADLKLKSNVGSVEVKYSDAAPAACNVQIATNVGSIDFAGPPQISAKLDASTNVGSIKTGKPVTVVGKLGKSVKGTIGSGEGKLHLRTNVGSIEIK